MKKKVLIFIVCYNAERFITDVLSRIPHEIWHSDVFNTEILIIDDESIDQTFNQAIEYIHHNHDLKITLLHNPKIKDMGEIKNWLLLRDSKPF